MTAAIVLFVVLVTIRLIPHLAMTNNTSAQRRQIERVPARKIITLAENTHVRIVGAAMQLAGSDEVVTGPYSGRPGLAIVYERYALGRRRARVQLLDRQVRHTPFAIEDETGTIALDLSHARFALDMAPAELAQRGPGRVFGADIIAGNELAPTDNDEGGVVPGNRLTVSGFVQRNADGILVLAGTQADPLVMVSLPSDR